MSEFSFVLPEGSTAGDVVTITVTISHPTQEWSQFPLVLGGISAPTQFSQFPLVLGLG